jgi:hypothetical protein
LGMNKSGFVHTLPSGRLRLDGGRVGVGGGVGGIGWGTRRRRHASDWIDAGGKQQREGNRMGGRWGKKERGRVNYRNALFSIRLKF